MRSKKIVKQVVNIVFSRAAIVRYLISLISLIIVYLNVRGL